MAKQCHHHILQTQSVVLLALAAWLLAFSAANAQEVSNQTAQLRAIYAELMLDPTDMDKTLAYAELAKEMGDYEAAIAPLERLMLSYPNSSALKLQLGQLYQKLGAEEAARGYFVDIIDDNTAEAAHRMAAEQALGGQ